MYDFCFTYPYAVLLALGGLISYATKDGTGSLGGGVGLGAVLLYLLAHISLRYYRAGKLWKTGTFLSLVVSAALTVIMSSHYQTNRKVFPAGVFAILCGAMSLFYVWSLYLGPQPKKKKTGE